MAYKTLKNPENLLAFQDTRCYTIKRTFVKGYFFVLKNKSFHTGAIRPRERKPARDTTMAIRPRERKSRKGIPLRPYGRKKGNPARGYHYGHSA